MFLLVGLGNPGPKYAPTRHNVGFMVLDELARRLGEPPWRGKFKGQFIKTEVAGRTSALLKPETFMNLSGESVRGAADYFKVKPEQVVIVHDELDLPFGTLRVKQDGGVAGHNGLKSVRVHLGTARFMRLRFGIGRPPDGATPVDRWVLSPFSALERAQLGDLLPTCLDMIDSLITQGLNPTMNAFHATK